MRLQDTAGTPDMAAPPTPEMEEAPVGYLGNCWRLESGDLDSTLRWTNIAIENGPFEDVFPIENGNIPLLC